MSFRKSVPDGLKPQEVERNSTHKAPIPYVPERDELQESLELKQQYTKLTQPNGVEVKHLVWDGNGNREQLLNHTSSSLGVIVDMDSRKTTWTSLLRRNKRRTVWNRPS